MKVFRIFLLFVFISACNAPRATYDYDQQVDFTQFQSYGIFPDLVSGLSQLDEKRLINSLHEHLSKKGFPIDSLPDLYINVYSQEFQETSGNTLGIGVGGGGGNLGVGVSGGIPIGGPETYLRLTVDIIDAQKDELIWQAIVEGKFNKNVSPETRQAALDKMVRKALKGFPPE